MYTPAKTTAVIKDCPGTLTDTPAGLTWWWGGPNEYPLLACASWDGLLTVWEVQVAAPLNNRPSDGLTAATGNSDPIPHNVNPQGKFQKNVGSPALCCSFITAQIVVVGTLDNRVLLVNHTTGEIGPLGVHDGPVIKVFADKMSGVVVSVGLDRMIKWWSVKSPGQPACTQQTPTDPCAADMNDTVLAVVCEGPVLFLYNPKAPQMQPKRFEVQAFVYPVISVALHPQSTCCMVGAMEGRARVINFQNRNDDFSFRCHRMDRFSSYISPANAPPVDNLIFAVNGCDFNPIYHTAVSCGGDGHVITWDYVGRIRLAVFEKFKANLSCVKFDLSGRLLAVGVGYDWVKGSAGKSSASTMYKVCVMSVPDGHIKRKKPN